MISKADDQLRREIVKFDLRCTCEWCGAFDPATNDCAYGYPTEPHRHLPLAETAEFVFCKAFELV